MSQTTAEPQGGIIGRLRSAWRNWFTVKSTDREEAFIERTLRGVLPVIFIIFLVASVGSLASEIAEVRATVVLEFIISNVMIIGAWAALVRGQIRLSALLTVGRFAVALVTITNSIGYWAGAVVPLAILVVLLASLILSGRLLVWSAILAALVVPVIGAIQGSAGLPVPMVNGIASASPLTSGIAAFLTIMLVLRYAIYQRNEFVSRVNEVNELVATLEDRVKRRTYELDIAKREAEVARDAALDADRLKSQFLASMSHELRTPLNAILTFSELMGMDAFGEVNTEQKDYLDKIHGSGKHLLSLINDVLDITKIQSGMIKLFYEPGFVVKTEIATVIQTVQGLIGNKPVSLVTDIADDLPPLTCDKRRLRQILLNLASNAAKFTETGTITLRAKRQDDSILFSVVDTGPGIAKDQQKLIFEPFIQTETGIKHAGGTGLGLPISLNLTEAHGGSMWVESDLGQGAAFHFTIPLQPVTSPTNHSKDSAV